VLKDPAAASPALADEMKGFVKDKIATGKIQRFKLRA
jgi:hypothetical protein